MVNASTPRPRGRPRKEKAAEPVVTAQEVAAVVESFDDRPPLRREMRDEDPRARAAARAAAIREHIGDIDEGTDEFYIPAEVIPEGWNYEWKRRLLMGAEDPAYQVQLARNGWEPVPASRHPEMMPSTGNYQTIERKLLNRIKLMANEGQVNLVDTNDRMMSESQGDGATRSLLTENAGNEASSAAIRKVSGW